MPCCTAFNPHVLVAGPQDLPRVGSIFCNSTAGVVHNQQTYKHSYKHPTAYRGASGKKKKKAWPRATPSKQQRQGQRSHDSSDGTS